MTFSSKVKDEVSRLETSKTENIAELSAIVRNTIERKENSFDIVLENNAVARRIFKLFKDIYQITPQITVRKRYNFNKNLTYILTIKHHIENILIDLSYYDENHQVLNIPKDYLISDEEEVRAYIRGIFVSVGSVNDPKTSRYHLELSVDNASYADFIHQILNDHYLNSRIIKREKNYMVYIKEAEKISDFLRLIKAYSAVLYFEDIRIYRDHKNMTNRLNNCEQANIEKVFQSSHEQIRDILILKKYDMLEFLDEKLQEACEYRLKYPETSLKELSEIISVETGNIITKSGLNHRFRKIKEIVSNLNEKNIDK